MHSLRKNNYSGNFFGKYWLPLILAVIALFYFIFDPMEWGFMPRCVFHQITGLQCMGCGSQRMLHALLHGDIAGAFKANALFTCSLPFILFLLWLEMYKRKYSRLYARVHSIFLIISVGVVLLLWMILRNILGI